jgi:hypothetical protein
MVAESSSARADQQLYIPVAGPWLDLVHRPDCSGPACSSEFANRALIATDGILQGLGVFMTLAGLLSLNDQGPDSVQTAKRHDTTARAVHVSPAQFGASTYGVAAFGRF